MCSYRNVFKNRIGSILAVSFVVLVFVLHPGYGAGQAANPGANDQQGLSQNQLPAQPACYLGEAWQAPGAAGYGSQMPASAEDQYLEDGQAGGDSQQGNYPQQGTYYQQGGYSQQGTYYQQGLPYGSDQAQQAGQYPQYPMSQAQQAGQYPQYPIGQEQQGVQYGPQQSEMEQVFNQSVISPQQIIAILQQAPDALTTFKDLAGRQYAVDPSIIPDEGVYNCIRQDPDFRNQVVAQLAREGYLRNLQQQAGGAYPSRAPLTNNRGIGQQYQYPYSPRQF
ncbi:MAG: hypothetical protein ACRD19_08525, partial [Terriglobia bacterium]